MRASPQRWCLHQYHHSVSPADAVTKHLFLIRSALLNAGIRSSIFADHVHPSLSKLVRRREDPAIWNADLLLVHHSMGNPRLDAVRRIEVPKAMVFHNITPAKFFKHDPFLKRLARLGLKQIRALARDCRMVYTVSAFNQTVLKTHGIERPRLLPLLDLSTVPGEGTGLLTFPREPRTLLFVGKLLPHKNQARLIEVLACLNRHAGEKHRLVLVGRHDPLYRRYVELLARSLGVEKEVVFAGAVADHDLINYYRLSDAYVSLSRHEGFAVPIVEAMRAELPVFALAAGAVEETLGGAGVILRSESPDRVAAIVRGVLSCSNAVPPILEGQKRRLSELETFQNRSRLLEILLDALRATREPARAGKSRRRDARRASPVVDRIP